MQAEIPIVSVVIVCMNNLRNLYPCLKSLKYNTTISYECFVVAYLFSDDNLKAVKHDFPWVIIIESNEIRGFSENNNLALQYVSGQYCFILNDDTEMRMPVIDLLVQDIKELPNQVAVVSPRFVAPDGVTQVCGRPPFTWYTHIFDIFHVSCNSYKRWIDKIGLFQSYNILGAGFLIKTSIFRKVGLFDEQYFFCPEDIALSTLLNHSGYECWVDSNIELIHKEGMSSRSLSMIQTATAPASELGRLKFFSEGKWYLQFILIMIGLPHKFAQMLFHFVKSLSQPRPNYDSIRSIGEKNSLSVYFTHKTPKEVFTHYYKQIK